MALKLSQSTAVGGHYSIVERHSWKSMLPWALVMTFSEKENEKGAHSSGTYSIGRSNWKEVVPKSPRRLHLLKRYKAKRSSSSSIGTSSESSALLEVDQEDRREGKVFLTFSFF